MNPQRFDESLQHERKTKRIKWKKTISRENRNKVGQEKNFKKNTLFINLREIQNYTACIKLVLSSLGKAKSHKIKLLKIKYIMATFFKMQDLKDKVKKLIQNVG